MWEEALGFSAVLMPIHIKACGRSGPQSRSAGLCEAGYVNFDSWAIDRCCIAVESNFRNECNLRRRTQPSIGLKGCQHSLSGNHPERGRSLDRNSFHDS